MVILHVCSFRDSLLSDFKVYERFYLCFFYVIKVSVCTMDGKRKRVVRSLDKFRVIRAFDYPRFPRSTLPRIIETVLYKVSRKFAQWEARR